MKTRLAIIGSGPAALALAAFVNEQAYEVTIYEQNTAPGRKFLVAGKGGFNLTHSEELDPFIQRYHPATFFDPLLRAFSNKDFRQWLETIGIPTYTGTSKRVFPMKGIKPIEVLRAITNHLEQKGTRFCYQYRWKGIASGRRLLFDTPQGTKELEADRVVFALGGGSWKVTGSDGNWLSHFEALGISCFPFQPSNCAFGIDWPASLREQWQGQALKNCVFSCGDQSRMGEAVLTADGIEGSGVYPLSPAIREQLTQNGKALLSIDFKPGIEETALVQRLRQRQTNSISKFLENDMKLNDAAFMLLKTLDKESYTDPLKLATAIKKFPLYITALAPLDAAISTVGGLALSEIDAQFQLKQWPQHYAIGEMLDWDAPTGGYLLQGCFSMGHALATVLNTGLTN